MADAQVISYRETDDLMVCRLRLKSGEKLFIKVLSEPTFAGVWELGSMNPVTIALDRLIGMFTGHRTAGLIQLWGLNANDIGGPEKWLAIIDGMFDLKGGSRTPLRALTDSLRQFPGVEEVRLFIADRERLFLNPVDDEEPECP